MNRRHKGWAITGTLLLSALAACSGGRGGQKTQVVARVNDAEITLSQLQAALLAKGDEQSSPKAAHQTVESLVNEQLLVDAALRNKLDRDPGIVMAMESARRQVLVRAYLERMVFPKQEISVADQTAYFKNHPALFAQRRTYQLTLFNLSRDKLEPAVLEALGAAHVPEQVSAVLAAHGIESDLQTLTRAAEQLPIEQLPRLAAAEVGDVILQPPQAGHLSLLLITGIQSTPIAFESAQPIIQQYLTNMRNMQALEAQIKQARSGAKISYVDGALLSLNAAAPATVGAAPAARPAAIEHF